MIISKSKSIIIKSLAILIETIALFLVLRQFSIFKIYSLFQGIVIATLIILVINQIFSFVVNNQTTYKKYCFFIINYLLLLIMILYIRKDSTNRINQQAYFTTWLKIIFTNQIVFINIIGNIFLMIPLGIIVKTIKISWFYKTFIILLIVCSIEILQYLLNVGVFDIYDILLYILGIIIGVIGFPKNFKIIKGEINGR